MFIKNEKLIDVILHAIESMFFTVITDEKGNILFMSKSYRELFNLAEEDVVGKHVHDIIPNSKIPQVLETGVETIGDIFEMIDGREVICNRILIRDDASQEILGVLTTATFNNIDELEVLNKKIEQLEQINLKYKKTIKKLQKINTAPIRIISASDEIRNIKDTISKIASTKATVLITGETGTGKEIFANHIHLNSDRRDEKFVKINCSAIPKDLIESELFGYGPGAFSGALKEGKIGKFELANKGSILLDEIGEMPYNLQSKLLRVIQEREIVRLGDNKTIDLDVRIICSTNKKLTDLIKKGEFREDLYYRINVVELEIPPLRKRIVDISPLCHFFIEKFNISYGLGIHGIDEQVITRFHNYSWPGNVRELENVIERACLLKGSGYLSLEDFTFYNHKLLNESDDVSNTSDGHSVNKISLSSAKEDAEKSAIIAALEATSWNKTKAALKLGIDRSNLYTKLKKYDIS